MRKIILCLLVSFGVTAQTPSEDHELEDMCLGVAAALNETFDVFGSKNIAVKNNKSGEITYQSVMITNDHSKSYFTVIAIKLTENFAIVLGYAPGITGKNFNGYGEFVMCKREDGYPSKVTHLYEPLTKFAKNNEPMEYLKNNGVTVVIKDKFEVDYFEIEVLNRTYFLPNDYFEYKLLKQTNPRHEKVRSYKKKDGTRVEGYRRTQKNRTERDNFSTKPNRNPYTGKKGYKTSKK